MNGDTRQQPASGENSLHMPLADDWHIHLRDGPALQRTVADASRYCRRLVAMPNLPTPIVSVALAEQYRDNILAALPAGRQLEPLVPLYLTAEISEEEIRRAAQADFICGAKLYPAGATTLSEAGITDLQALQPVLQAMEKYDLPLLVHAEATDPAVDVFDREQVFIEQFIRPWAEDFPQLRIVVEHISTAAAAEFVAEARPGIAATITAHHLLISRNHLLGDGLRPHLFCLPVAKKEEDRQALLDAATCGSEKFFLGTDSAPHIRSLKEAACGCAGIYTAFSAIELYAEAFDSVGALDRLPAFACEFGARFYRHPVSVGPVSTNEARLLLQPEPTSIPSLLDFAGNELVPFRAGETLRWKVSRIEADESTDESTGASAN